MKIFTCPAALFSLFIAAACPVYALFDHESFKSNKDCPSCQHYAGHYFQKNSDGSFYMGVFLNETGKLQEINQSVNLATQMKCKHIETIDEGREFKFHCR